jgi:hypothetical protein
VTGNFEAGVLNEFWDGPVRLLLNIMPEDCQELTVVAELDYGWSEIGIFSLQSEGERERVYAETKTHGDLSSQLLRLRHEISQANGGQEIEGCEIVVGRDGAFKYKLRYPNS